MQQFSNKVEFLNILKCFKLGRNVCWHFDCLNELTSQNEFDYVKVISAP